MNTKVTQEAAEKAKAQAELAEAKARKARADYKRAKKVAKQAKKAAKATRKEAAAVREAADELLAKLTLSKANPKLKRKSVTKKKAAGKSRTQRPVALEPETPVEAPQAETETPSPTS